MKNLFILFVAFPFIQFNTLAQLGEFKLLSGSGVEYDHFGISVSISGEYAIVGTALDDDNGERIQVRHIYLEEKVQIGRRSKN